MIPTSSRQAYFSPPTATITLPASPAWEQMLKCVYAVAPTVFSAKAAQVSLRRQFIHNVESFATLKDGWLGRDSHGIPPETVNRVIALANEIESVDGLPNPELTPNPNGTISLEWESARGEAHFEYGKTRISAFIRVDDGPPKYIKDAESLSASVFRELRNTLFPSDQSYSLTAIAVDPYSYAPAKTVEMDQIALSAE